MDSSTEKNKLMTNNAAGIKKEIKLRRQKLGNITAIKYLGAIVSDDSIKSEVLSETAQVSAAFTKPIRRDNNISLG